MLDADAYGQIRAGSANDVSAQRRHAPVLRSWHRPSLLEGAWGNRLRFPGTLWVIGGAGAKRPAKDDNTQRGVGSARSQPTHLTKTT